MLVLAGVVVVLTVGAVLRLMGIGFGNPFVYHPDEGFVVKSAMAMVDNRDWNPHNFFYSSLVIDVQALLVAVTRFAGGPPLETGQGWLFEGEAVPWQFRYFFVGRLFVASTGLATIALTYLIGRRWWGTAAGLAAAAVVAVAPLHVSNSRFATTDVPLALLCTVTLFASFEAYERRQRRWWVAAGVAAGLAVSTKWNGAAVLVVPMVTYLLTLRSGREVLLAVRDPVPYMVVGAAAVALLATTPALILDWSSVRAYLELQAELYSRVRGGGGTDGLGFHLRALAEGMGPIVAAAGVLGLLVGVLRRPRPTIVVPVFVLLYVAIISIPATHFDRNLMPVVPYVALGVGVLLATGARLLVRRTQLASRAVTVSLAAALLTALAPGAMTALDQGRQLMGTDTRTLAYDWLLANVERNTVVARELYTPQLAPDVYRLRGHDFLSRRNMAWYDDVGTRYLVTSSTIYDRFYRNPSTPGPAAFYEELFQLREVFRADPGPTTPGPTIRIFELPQE